MKPKVTNLQIVAVINLIKNLKDFQNRGYGSITNMATFFHFGFPDAIFLRYEKDFTSGDDRIYEYKIAKVDKDGTVMFIDDNFKNIFERYSFLGESKPFDIENPNDYEKVD